MREIPKEVYAEEVPRGCYPGVRVRIFSHEGEHRLSIRMEDARMGGINLNVRWLPAIRQALERAEMASAELFRAESDCAGPAPMMDGDDDEVGEGRSA